MTLSVTHIHDILLRRQRHSIDLPSCRRAAVLMPIVRRNDSFMLLLTKRTDDVEHHKGQISFPGGMVDAGDSSAVGTALRETEEEIGLPREYVSLLGMLDDIHIPSGFIVTPIVGYVDALPDLTVNKDEVAEVLHIPLEKFFDCTLRRSEIRELLGVQREVYFYDVWNEPVWGATAAIIKQFTDLFGEQ
ncbi:MAG: CoA pyrophosphatase [Bacteroidota bacterium]|jgi:8-oxo-dGTP pyrophosphatase MutT (NUDIX family)